MNKSLSFRKKLYSFIFILFTCFIFFYITYFLIYSDRGIIKHFVLKNDFNKKTINYNALSLKNNNLINNINKLKLNSIDLDYLDEQNIKKNGYLNNNDIIIVFSEN